MLTLNIHTAEGQRSCQVPESWDELNAKQLVTIARMLFTEGPALKRQLAVAACLCDIPMALFKRMPEISIIEDILPVAAWVYAEDQYLTAQLIPTIAKPQGGKPLFYGPQSHLRNLLFVEFDEAERALAQWQESQQLSDMCRFIAVLYRPAKKGYDMAKDQDGDVRLPYNAHLTASYADSLQSLLDPGHAYAIVIWYKGCRQYIAQCFPSVFAKNANDDEFQSLQTPSYFKLMRSIAEKGTYGTYDQVEQLPIYNVFAEMEAAQEERETVQDMIGKSE